MDQIKNTPKILSENLFPVVGIGASAGGLDAFKQFIKTIPEESGMAYILVQHLDPLHESILSEILQRTTKLPVLEIQDNMKVAPDHIYIIPSNKLLIASDGILKLSPRPPKGQANLPIDVFFSSLAEVHQEHAIGVLFSGTGTDGTVGLNAIKAHGGLTIVQETGTAAYPGMPQNAIDSGAANFILRPDKVIDKLKELNLSFKLLSGNEKPVEIRSEDNFKNILALIRVRKDVDFTYYKQSTIQRRILRRMALKGIPDVNEYYNYLLAHKQEQDILYQDLLIPVTSFFRDPDIFKDVSEKVFPVITKNKSVTEPLRIWVAGCSSGEEAYTIGICLLEYLGKKASAIKIQIFATDISEVSIAKARAGIYSKAELNGVSEDLVQKYFTKIDGNYHINKSLRNLCVFAHHNLLKDPPFAKLDLISCRNVLIYFQNYLQKKAFSTFHYALNEKGFLALGKSENVSINSELFNPSGKNKIFIKKEAVETFRPVATVKRTFLEGREKPQVTEPKKDDFQRSVDEIIIHKYSAVGVIVNDQLDIVQFRGSTGPYLEAPPGKATLNVLKMARGDLAYELRIALQQAKTTNEVVAKDGIVLDNGKRTVSFDVTPLLNTIEPYFLILFNDDTHAAEKKKTSDPNNTAAPEKDIKDIRIEQLEKELARTKEDMRSITEEQDAANEELQSANEELLSGSEELQSLNEELETTKEEIQSTNEELTIVNHELIDRNEQLVQSRLFAEAVVTTLHEPLLIMNKDLRIVSANPAFYKTFNLKEDDTNGKILFELQNAEWDIPDLRTNLFEIQTGKSKFKEWQVACKFSGIGERYLGFNAQPIQREKDDHLVLLTIDDLTLRKKEEEHQKSFSEELERKIVERTMSLQKSNLDLEYSNENLNQFAFIASHDLQEPLRKLQIFVHILAERFSDALPGDLKDTIKKIGRSASRMSELIRDVLNFSRISNIEHAYIKTDINEILENVLTDLDLLIAEKEAIINKGKLPVISGVPVLINQLFNNIITNAIKFSNKEKKLEITISSRMLSRDEVEKHKDLDHSLEYSEIMIRDNGIGFDQKFAEQVFVIFQRLDTQSPGTGIGLALCKKIVLNHKGSIRVDSNAGEGATFFIVLPVYNEKTVAAVNTKSLAVQPD